MPPVSETFTPGTSVGTSTTGSPAAAQLSMALSFASSSARPRRVSYVESHRPSNCRKAQLTPAERSMRAYPGSSARRRPLVLSWKKEKPFSLPRRTMSGRSSRMVGSPPESWMLKGPPRSMSMSYRAEISPSVGSPEPSPAEAKQTGQRRLQRFVSSRSTQQPALSCSSHRPQSRGQPSFTGTVLSGAFPPPGAVFHFR